MANLRTIQFLRSNRVYETLSAATAAMTTQASTLSDGSPIVGRYMKDSVEKSVFGIVHIDGDGVHGITYFNNEDEFQKVLDGLDYSGITTSDAAVVTNVTEENGLIAATSANVGNLKLTDYTKGSDSGSVVAADSINEAVAKLENQIDAEKDARAAAINALDASTVSGESTVVIDVTQDNGLITASAANLSGVKLAGYTVGGDDSGKVAATDTLGEALGKLQGQINGMDKAADVVAGQVVTTVTEADGKVTETKANVKDLQLGGYAKTNDTGDIASADTINVALSKLENQIKSNDVENADGSINITAGTNGGTDINVNIKSGEHVLAKDGGNGLYTDIALSSITPSSTTVKEEYQLTATDGTKLGDTIKIYKDSSVVSITYDQDPESAHYQNLVYTYIDVSGNTQTEYVDISALLIEAEFESGVTANAAGVVHGVVDADSEKVITAYDPNGNTTADVLTVDADGFKVSNIQNAINAKVGTLDVAEIAAGAGKFIYAISEEDGIVSANSANVSDAVLNGYSKGTDATAVAAADTLNEAISKLENQVDKAKAAATTKVVEGTDAGNNLSIASATSADDGSVTYTINLTDVASKDALDAEIAARKAVDGQEGQTYAANTGANYISDATDLNDADVKLDAALKAKETELYALSAKTVTEFGSSNSSVTITTAATADGTVSADVITDASKIKLSGYVESTSTTEQVVAASDTVVEAVQKLYANIKHHHSRGSEAIAVDVQNSGSTISLILDDSSALSVNNGNSTDNGNNALTITSDGLFLSKDWDCGSF